MNHFLEEQALGLIKMTNSYSINTKTTVSACHHFILLSIIKIPFVVRILFI